MSARPLAAFFAALVVACTLPVSLQGQENPHGVLPSGLDCSNCHSSVGWSPTLSVLDFDHASTGFPLTGSHSYADCAGCHLSLEFSSLQIPAQDCVSCHFDVHQTGLPDDCTSCHNTESFQDVPGLQLHMQTQFPLTGVHLQVTCESCHVNDARGAFGPLDADCVSCHRENYEQTATIDHQSLGFPTACESCHGTLSWAAAAGLDHASLSNGFTLVGAHVRTPCSSCHVLPTFESLFNPTQPEDCVACHQTDYDQQHIGSGFSTNCLDCHNQDEWDGAQFNHDGPYFPIYSGKHQGRWNNQCTTCHTDPTDFKVFTCLNCHEHRQSEADAEHREVNGYAYDSNLCYSCHRNP